MEASVLMSLRELQTLLDAASKVSELEKSIVQLRDEVEALRRLYSETLERLQWLLRELYCVRRETVHKISINGP